MKLRQRKTTTSWAAIIAVTAIPFILQDWANSGVQAAPPSSNQSGNATVQIVGNGPGKNVSPSFLGSNIENAFNKSHNPDWGDPTLASYLATFAGILRFPAGTAANYWDWSIGWGYPNFTWPNSDYVLGTQGSTVDTPENLSGLISLIEQSGGATPDVAYVLNILSTNDDGAGGRLANPDASDDQSMINDQLQMLNDAASSAHMPVHYIELGNEFYLHGIGSTTHATDYCQAYPSTTAPSGTCSASGTALGDANDDSGAGYAARVNNMMPLIKAQYPNAKVAVVGENPLGWGSSTPYRAQNWNSKMLPILRGADAVIFHDYPTMSWNQATPQAVAGLPFYDWSNAGMKAAIDVVGNYGINEVWITEFDFNDNTSPSNPSASVFAPTWVHGLANSQMLIQYLTDTIISHVEIYSASVDPTTASAIYYPGTSLSLPLDTPQNCSTYEAPNQFQCTVAGPPASGCLCTIPSGGEAVLTATGQAMGLFGRGLSGATSVKPLMFSGNPTTSVTLNATPVTYPDVTGVQVFNANGFQLIISNYSQSSLTLNISWTGKKKAKIESLSAPSLMTYVISNTTLSDTMSSTNNGVVTLPPNSINRIF